MSHGVVVVTGPTATGKTKLGAMIARAVGGEVVGADSMQIYRGMDIGTAKPEAEEMMGVVHHMIDVADPCENWSVAKYVEAATQCCDGIIARGKTPVIVGGTGLYIDSLIEGRSFAAGEEHSELREALSAEFDAVGGGEMLRRLAGFDPESASRLSSNDKKRIVRAFEVYRTTGDTITHHNELTKAAPPRYRAAKIGLSYANRERLYERINARVDTMIAKGLAREVEELLASGLPDDCTAMQAIGYKEMVACLRGGCTLDEAAENIKRTSRRYAKRQLSWLRRDRELQWILWEGEPDFDGALLCSTEFLEKNGII